MQDMTLDDLFMSNTFQSSVAEKLERKMEPYGWTIVDTLVDEYELANNTSELMKDSEGKYTYGTALTHSGVSGLTVANETEKEDSMKKAHDDLEKKNKFLERLRKVDQLLNVIILNTTIILVFQLK